MTLEKEIINYNKLHIKYSYTFVQTDPKIPANVSSKSFIDDVKIVGVSSGNSVIMKAAVMPCTNRYVAEYGKQITIDVLKDLGIKLPNHIEHCNI